MAFDWPGNVRQLENVMERAFALSPGRTQIGAIRSAGRDPRRARRSPASTDCAIPEDGVELERLVSDFEHALIRARSNARGGNKRQAADLLHVKRTTLIEKLKRLERP